jgi:hypothetical protein
MQSAPLSRKRSERALPADLQPRIRTSPRRSNFVALCACSLISLAAPSAFADPTPEDVATAKALVRTARELRAAGEHPAALDKYRAAYALVPTPITGIELAEELASNGLLVDGREMFLTVAKMPAKDGEKREYTEARAKAAERANELGPRIPTLIVRVHPSVVAGDVHVSIDGREIPAAALGLPRKVNPGEHALSVRVGAGAPFESTVTMVEAETREVVLKPASVDAKAGEAVVPSVPSRPPYTSPSHARCVTSVAARAVPVPVPLAS